MAETKVTGTTIIHEEKDVIYKAKGFWNNYSKPIIYIGSAVIILIAGWYAYKNFVVLPKEKKADDLVFPAENIFDKMATSNFTKDSVNLVLNGGNVEGTNVTGLLKIISNYGGSKAANRAKYMVGASYLQIKEFDKAIKYLKDFDAGDAEQVKSKAYIMLGHAYAEKKQVGEALDYYKKASNVNEKDESVTPDALMLAASYADAMGKKADAIELFKKLKDKYPAYSSVSSGEVDKYLARLGEFE